MDFLKRLWAFIVSIPQDKLLHLEAGDTITLYSFVLLLIFVPYWHSLGCANIIAAVFLIGKEVYDALHPEGHSVECKDVLAGLAGVVKVDIALAIIGWIMLYSAWRDCRKVCCQALKEVPSARGLLLCIKNLRAIAAGRKTFVMISGVPGFGDPKARTPGTKLQENWYLPTKCAKNLKNYLEIPK